MERRSLIIILLSIILVIILVLLFFLLKEIELSPVDLEECNSLRFNGDSKPNVVFFADKKTSEKYINYLLSFSPFSENKNEFNFYYINYKPACELYKGIAL